MLLLNLTLVLQFTVFLVEHFKAAALFVRWCLPVKGRTGFKMRVAVVMTHCSLLGALQKKLLLLLL